MKVFVNGEMRELANGTTIAMLVAALDLAGRRVAVEVNEEIVPKAVHAQTLLRDNDRVEIVHAIGGG
ncbi:MAG: sulfur carrier protein ThiS [Pseudomonadota bacterium]